MRNSKSSPLSGGMQSISISSFFVLAFFGVLEITMFVMFFATYAETISMMSSTYLSELPILGALFAPFDTDANASHLIALLLAVFSVATPIFIWSEVFRQGILDNPREWFCHTQNQILAGVALFILALVIALEAVNLYTLVAKQSLHGGYIQQLPSGVMGFLAQNKALAIGVSIIFAIINIVLACFTTRAAFALKNPLEV